ncbi:hypothetical protein, partial [Klebsiella quasipneumoniae]
FKQSFFIWPRLLYVAKHRAECGVFVFVIFFKSVTVLTDLKSLSSVRLTISDNSPVKGQFSGTTGNLFQ